MTTIAFVTLAWAAPKELIFVVVVALILFGGSRLPQIGRLLGKSLVEFRKGLKEAKDEFTDATGGLDDDDDKPSTGKTDAAAEDKPKTKAQCNCDQPADPADTSGDDEDYDRV